MKKAIVISTLIATSIFTMNNANAKSSTEEDVGFASGAVAGAAIGGPVGFIIGATLCVMIGEEVHKAGEYEAELTLAQSREQQLQEELSMIQENLALETTQQNTDVQWVTEGISLNVMFTTNSSNLSDADRSNIAKLSRVMNQFPELVLRLDGYTDPRGSKTDNLLLSQKRVDSVIAAFELNGVESQRITGFAHGELDGSEKTSSPDDFAMARKVSVNFITARPHSVAQN